ncbi:MAG: FAD-dependent oxidoreductase [Spirochaetes bacterium]|nr:FAD-dependent oxidoreductase [Spirochaetota bacterium]
MSDIVIAGLGSAGYAALASIKRRNPKISITVIDSKESDLVHPCGLPYSLEGSVDPSDLSQDIGLARMGVTKIRGSLIALDAERRSIRVDSGGEERGVPYSLLLLSLGSVPVIPPLEGLHAILGNRAFTLHSIGDLEAIRKCRETSKRCVIVGAGAIGLETATALSRTLDDVRVLEMQGQVLPGVMDEEIARVVEEYIASMGINVELNARVTGISPHDGGISIATSAGAIRSDFSVISTGFAANIAALRDSGLRCNQNGIEVDRHLHTSAEGIYAAGDCISGWSVIDGAPLKAKLATSAYKQGTVAGMNAAGGSMEYRGSSGTFVTRISGLEVAGTGYTTEGAKRQGFRPQSGKIKSSILPEYFPDNRAITIKIIADSATGRILGAQAVGEGGAAERINLLSAAVEMGMTLEQLGRVEMAYCPAVSEVYDPVMRAADFAARRIKP